MVCPCLFGSCSNREEGKEKWERREERGGRREERREERNDKDEEAYDVDREELAMVRVNREKTELRVGRGEGRRRRLQLEEINEGEVSYLG